MEITLTDLLEGKGTVIKDKEYFPTRNYIEPFVEKLSKYTNDFRIQVKLPQQMTTINESLDKTYNRVWIQAVLPESYSFDNYKQVLGLIYGLDVKKPIVKIYRGGLNMACTNLCVFNPSWLNTQLLEDQKSINYRPMKELLEYTDDLKVTLDKLHNITFDRDFEIIHKKFGEWIHNTILFDYNNGLTQKVKLATSNVIDTYKSLFIDESSKYFLPKEVENVSMYDIYEAFTQTLTDGQSKDLINTVEKTLLLKNILSI